MERERGKEIMERTEDANDERDLYGLYEASQGWRWSLFCPQKGDVMVVRIPEPLAKDAKTYGAFAVVQRDLWSDGSLMINVKSLGCTDPALNPVMSKRFNRRTGYIHCCHSMEDCQVEEGAVFHCRTVELADGENFSADYVTVSGKRTLKQVRQDLAPDQYSPEILPAQDDPPAGAEVPLEGGENRGKGGEVPGKKENYAALRARLEAVKRGREGGTGDPQQDEKKRKEAEAARGLSAGGVFPTLSSNLRMAPIDGSFGQVPLGQTHQVGSLPANPGGPNGPIMSPWSGMSGTKDIGSQLMMRAAANYSGGAGGGSLPPTAGNVWSSLLQSDKKKKKKKKKKKSGKKKQKKHKKRRGGGGSSGGGGSGGSSPSSSSDSSGSAEDSMSSDSVNLPPLRRRATKHPGSVLRLLLNQIEAQLSEVQGYEGQASSLLGGTKVLTFFNLLVRGSGVQVQSRDGREMYLIAVLLDLLRSGQLDKVADGLAARFMALQTAVIDGGWQAARHLEIYTPDIAMPGGPSVTLAARKHAKVLEKVQGKDSRSDRYGSRAWNRPWGTQSWQRQEEAPQEGGKGKNKKGKGGKGKSNAWSGKGGSSWRGGSAAEGRGNKEEKGDDKPQAESK